MEIEIIKSLTEDFFQKLCIEIESIEINIEEENIINISLKTPDSPLVIGYSGKNLEDIRTVLKQILRKSVGENLSIHIEVNDYLEQKEIKLIDFVKKKIELAKSTGKEIVLPFFNSYERKKIHNFVSELNDKEIGTKSVGEGKERRLHIYKKFDTKSIDLDAIDI